MWRRVERISAAAGLLVLLAQAIPPVRSATGAALGWLYPDKLIALLGLLFILSFAATSSLVRALARTRVETTTAQQERAAAERERDEARAEVDTLNAQLNPARRERDIAALKRIQEAVTRKTVTALRQQDFGARWETTLHRPVHHYAADFDEVEDRFLDEELEALRTALHAAAVSFSDALAQDTWLTPHADGLSDVGVDLVMDTVADEDYPVWFKRKTLLAEQADAFASAYDRLVSRAREKLAI
jgi:multidrug efflux pump subunit AcrA (membrane-fusion protein)